MLLCNYDTWYNTITLIQKYQLIGTGYTETVGITLKCRDKNIARTKV